MTEKSPHITDEKTSPEADLTQDGHAPDMQQVPEAKVLFLRDYCIRLKGEDCSRCIMACPHDAISFNDAGIPTIDMKCCTGCGICFGICDAFSSSRVTLLDLHARVKRIALRGETVCFTCSENIFSGLTPAANVIVLPCLACLPPEFWTLVLSENIIVKIACDLSYCADCERAGEIAETLYTHSVNTAERWTKKKVRFSDTIPEKEELLKDLTNPHGIDRRNIFTNFAGDIGDIATGKRRVRNSEVLQQFIERKERSRAINQLRLSEIEAINNFAPRGQLKKTMMPKRQMLLEAIKLDPTLAERVTLYLAQINEEDATYVTSESFLCPTGALFPDPDTGKLSLEERYCIGCSICSELYPESVIEIIETTAERFIEPEDSDDIHEDANEAHNQKESSQQGVPHERT